MTNGELPVFNGYTVDNRLREFRRMVYGELPEFISFDSPKGKRLLELYKRSQRRQEAILETINALDGQGLVVTDEDDLRQGIADFCQTEIC